MSLIIDIKVIPQSGRFLIDLDKSGIIKCFLKSPPEDGKANKELITLWSESLGISKDKVKIIYGLTSRKKKISIDLNLTIEQILEKLGLFKQQSFIKK